MFQVKKVSLIGAPYPHAELHLRTWEAAEPAEPNAVGPLDAPITLDDGRTGRGLWLSLASDFTSACPADQSPFLLSISSRRALNSVPGFHSGYLSPSATLSPTWKSSLTSSTAPAISQSGFTSSEGLW